MKLINLTYFKKKKKKSINAYKVTHNIIYINVYIILN